MSIRFISVQLFFTFVPFRDFIGAKKKYISGAKGGYSSVRRVVDQLEPRPWPFDDRTSTREVMVAYVAPAKFDDPPLWKSNGGCCMVQTVRVWDQTSFLHADSVKYCRPVNWFLTCDRKISELVNRELPWWQQRPDFAGNQCRFAAISDNTVYIIDVAKWPTDRMRSWK